MDISPALEATSAEHLYRVVEYSEVNEAGTLFTVKALTIQVVIETDTAEHQYRLVEYSELDTAMAMTWHYEPAAPPVDVEVTVGGSRPVGTFGPIMGHEFEQKLDATVRFSREFTFIADARIASVPATLRFSATLNGQQQFSKKVLFSYPGTRLVALEYSKVLREDRELIELMELGVL